MSTYSIKDLELISGIKAHTIRIWEQRYGLLEPDRTETNIRTYDDIQMRRLLNISSLLDNGEKVSKIASYSEEEINTKIGHLLEDSTKCDTQTNALINQVLSAGLTYNELDFNRSFDSAVELHGLLGAFTKVVYPMLVRLGLMWTKQDIIPSQEHFISNLIKQKLYYAIENQSGKFKKNAEKFILFLPEDEDHEIGLLLSTFLLKANGKEVLTLGQRVPYKSLKATIEITKPQAIHFFMIRNHSKLKVQKIIDNLAPITKGLRVYASGVPNLEAEINLPTNFKWINSIDCFLKELNLTD